MLYYSITAIGPWLRQFVFLNHFAQGMLPMLFFIKEQENIKHFTGRQLGWILKGDGPIDILFIKVIRFLE
ncbi:Uncharacterised protein [Mycobacteroides abscessus subsp. abscessus]|nr:Uncharacterised protein [Mycobacteroides abscessus subsp. abscessus]